MKRNMPEPDPRSRFEDVRIPDLQDGYPEQQWAVDPQEAPLRGDERLVVDEHGTMAEEQLQGEPLDVRLARDEPEQRPYSRIPDPSRSAGRLVASDAGTDSDVGAGVLATDVGPDAAGYTAEESAMHIEGE